MLDFCILNFPAVATIYDFIIISRRYRYRYGLHFVHGLQYWRTTLSFTGILDFWSSRQAPR
jgi:hypothetical protein